MGALDEQHPSGPKVSIQRATVDGHNRQGIALFLIAGTWVVATERFATFMGLSDSEAIALAFLAVTLIGLLTYLAGRIRPGWPDSDLAKASEFTRMQVQLEWSKPVRLAQDTASAMSFKARNNWWSIASL